jgi:Family of unknown function (DUF5333)
MTKAKGLQLAVLGRRQLRAALANAPEAGPGTYGKTGVVAKADGRWWRPNAVCVLAFGLMTSACVPTTDVPKLQPPADVTAQTALEEFMFTVSAAKLVGDRCGGYGIRKAFNGTNPLVLQYIAEMREQGYSQAELEQAADRLTAIDTTNRAIERLTAAGVRDGDLPSLCSYGQREIAKGSAVGKLLRSTT